MISKYNVMCGCGFKAKVEYGREDKTRIKEIFSCKKCNNIFSLNFDDKLVCPSCKGGKDSIVSYNPDKWANLEYYKQMADRGMLDKVKLKELAEFWKSIRQEECPKCGKQTLKWEKSR